MDDGEIEEKLLLYMNDLIRGLKLNRPPCKSIDDIQISTLVEINCRLNGLNFNDYIPSLDNPWDDVQGIIFTLQERFGQDKFQHLNARRIASHKVLHLACLLQILHTIYEHGRKKGHKFLPPSANTQDTTFLDESGRPEDRSEELEASDDDSGATVDELKFNFILEDTETEAGNNLSEDSAINSEEVQDMYYSFDSSFDSDDSGPSGKALPSGPPKDQTDTRASYGKSFPHSSTPKKVERKQLDQAIPFAGTKSITSHDEPNKITRKPKPTSSKVLAVGTIFEKEHAEDTEVSENQAPPPEDTSIEDFAAQAISQLRKIRAEIEDRVNKRMMDSILRLNQRDREPETKERSETKAEHVKSKPAPCTQRNANSIGFAGVGPIKHDHAGKPYRERFPYYPGGIIKVQCHASSKRRMPPPNRHGHAFGYGTSKSPADIEKEKKQKEIKNHMLDLQKTYNDELKALRKKFGLLVKKGGPKAFDRIRGAWTESYHRIRREAAKTVDSIIKAAEAMNAVN